MSPSKNFISIINNEDGFVLVLAILIMVVLSVIGITSSRTSRLELLIAGNDKVNKVTFYTSESAWQRGVQEIEDLTTPPPHLNSTDNTTIVLSNQTIANGSAGPYTYSYTTSNTPLSGNARKVPGSSGKNWENFRYTIAGTGSGPNNATSQVNVVIDKPFNTE